jgi:hypothetical protein
VPTPFSYLGLPAAQDSRDAVPWARGRLRRDVPSLATSRPTLEHRRYAVPSADRSIAMACATAARVAWVALSGLSIMKSCVIPS